MKAREIPKGRIGLVLPPGVPKGGLYILHFSSDTWLKIWPGIQDYTSAEATSIKDIPNSWEVELLPETTMVTFLMNGKQPNYESY